MADSSQQPSLPSELYDETYFLTSCEGYELFLTSEGEHLSRRLTQAFALASVAPGMRVLDIGCGRGEILRHCLRQGIEAYGIDYAEVAARMSRATLDAEMVARPEQPVQGGVCRADAKQLPFAGRYFDRVLLFDVVEHLYPWELHQALLEVGRILKPGGLVVIHTAPNRWYDAYAYPWVRRFRTLLGQGAAYPQDPRAITPANQHVHVNEQDMLSLKRALKAAGFNGRVWLDSPPQTSREGWLVESLRYFVFHVPPFRWFFERELFAIARLAQR